MNLFKHIFMLVCVAIPYCLYAMEKITRTSSLLQAVIQRKVDKVEEELSRTLFSFVSLADAYTYALKQAKKLTPNAEIRRDPFMQEAIKKIRLQREIALNRLADRDILQSPRGTIRDKRRTEQINTTLIDQGQLSLICAEKIYPILEPFLHENDYANILFLLLSETGYPDLLQEHFEMYRKYIDPNYGDLFGKTALHYAAENHQVAMVQCLLKNGSSPTITDQCGDLPLHYVAPGSNGNMEIFEMLLEAGTDIDSLNSKRETLLYKAVDINNPEAVAYLLALGANPNQLIKLPEKKDLPEQINFSMTLLELAEKRGNQCMARNFQEDNDAIITLLEQYIQKIADEKSSMINFAAMLI